MHKKNKQRKMFIFFLGVAIALMILRMLSGNESTVGVVIVNGEVNSSQVLTEQINNFQVIPMTKSESDRLGESVVRSLDELKGKYLKVSLDKGSPIPVSLLTSEKSVGDFAQKTRQFLTLYKIQGGTNMLPPGVAAGDLIDIGLLYQDTVKKVKTYSIVLKEVQIDSISETGDIYLQVSQSDAQVLTISKDMGVFVLQLPGKKEVANCENLTMEELKTMECYNEADKPKDLTAEDVLEKLREGVISEEKLNDSEIEALDPVSDTNYDAYNGGYNNSTDKEKEVDSSINKEADEGLLRKQSSN